VNPIVLPVRQFFQTQKRGRFFEQLQPLLECFRNIPPPVFLKCDTEIQERVHGDLSVRGRRSISSQKALQYGQTGFPSVVQPVG